MTERLKAALQKIRHLRGDLIFCGESGEAWTWHTIQLAMKGAAPKAIQELAGRKSMVVTMRYMHLTQTALRETIRLLEGHGQAAANLRHSDGTVGIGEDRISDFLFRICYLSCGVDGT